MKKTPIPWTSRELTLLNKLDAPIKIQNYLNGLVYDAVPGTRSPRWVIKERKASCFEGALFAAAALRYIGHPPLLVDMRARNDDDHVLAVFRQNEAWGCIAKSNFTVLRFREPVYRSIRELIMSYFDFFFNSIGEKTLREYTAPFNLARFDKDEWLTTDKDLDYIGDALDRARHIELMTLKMIRDLQFTDPALVKAGLIGANAAGLYKPKKQGLV
jgi:hypothetical protein